MSAADGANTAMTVRKSVPRKSELKMERFSDAKAHWSAPHRQVFCQHDKDTVVLFRACCEHLGPHATDTKCFRGSPCYEKDRTRMMWFDTSFLVSMRKSAWGTKRGREVVLAIWVERSFLEDCLGTAVCSDTFGPSCRGGGGGGGGGSCGNSGSGTSGSRGSGGDTSGNNKRDSPAQANGGGNLSLRSSSSFSPACSVAGSPPVSPTIERRHRQPSHQQDFPGAFSLGGNGGVAAGAGDAVGTDRASAAALATAAPLTKGGSARAGENEERDHDGACGQERRALSGRAVTGDPSVGAYFGGGIYGGGGSGAMLGSAGKGGHEGAARRRPRSQSLISPSYGGVRMKDGVRLHWEPERLPSGEKHRTRRVVQLGLKGKWLQTLGSGDAVVRIERLDNLLSEQRAALTSSEPQKLMVPVARALDVGRLQDAQLAALHMVSERARPKLRILCLHGYLQNRQVFSQRTRQLSKKLKNTAELVFVDAPHLLSKEELPPPLPSLSGSPLETPAAAEAAAATAALSPGEVGAPGLTPPPSPLPAPPPSPLRTPSVSTALARGEETVAAAAAAAAKSDNTRKPASGRRASIPDRGGARTWWRCDPEERRRAKAVRGMAGRCEWKGLEESLAYLRRVWDEQGPFDGLLGFSQGAAMASVFNHCAFGGGYGGSEVFTMPLLPPPRLGVFISGCFQPHPTQIPSYPLTQEQPQADLPSLHVWAVEDRFVPASQSQRLAGMYLRAAVIMHRGSHFVPQGKAIVPSFVRFFEGLR